MSLAQKGLLAASDHLPKVLSPKGHAIADYATIGGFVLMTIRLWNRHRRAALASLICGSAQAATVLMTDFPGGVAKVISFPMHGRIDTGLAAAASSLPNFLGFEKDPEAKLVRMMGLNITAITALTDFREPEATPYLKRIA